MKFRRRFALVVLIGSAAACLSWAAITFQRGNYMTAVLSLGVAAWWSIAAVIHLILPRMVAWATCDGSSTTIRPDRRLDLLMLASTVVGIPSLGLLAVLSGLGRLDLPIVTIGSYSETPSWIPLACGAVAGVWAVLLILILRLGGIGYIRLNPDEFEFAEAFRRTGTGRWSEVTDVNNVAPEGRHQATCPLVMVMADRQTHLLDNAAMYTENGQALRDLMRFYWLNPGHRIEFTDGRAVARLGDTQSGPGHDEPR